MFLGHSVYVPQDELLEFDHSVLDSQWRR